MQPSGRNSPVASSRVAPTAREYPGPVFSPALGLDVPCESALRFRNLPDAPFGVEVSGITWCRPDADTARLLTAAIRRCLLLVFRGHEPPSEADLDEFFRGLGRLVLDTEDGRAHYSGHRNLGGAGVGQVDDLVRDAPDGHAVEGDRASAGLTDRRDGRGAEAAGRAGDEDGAEARGRGRGGARHVRLLPG